MAENHELDFVTLKKGLKTIRKRRWYLWLVILVYLPLMGVTLKIIGSISGAVPVFGAWFAALLGFGLYSAYARCPRCGNYFHVHGMTLMYLRCCLHCQLHVSADKKVLKTQLAAPAESIEPPTSP